MKKLEINWRIVFWIGIVIILLWLFAKQFGYIHTPLVIELIPYIGAVLTLLAGAREAGKFSHKLDRVIFDVNEIKNDIKNIRLNLHDLDKRVAVLESKVNLLENKF